jgi:hypothetical protein
LIQKIYWLAARNMVNIAYARVGLSGTISPTFDQKSEGKGTDGI